MLWQVIVGTVIGITGVGVALNKDLFVWAFEQNGQALPAGGNGCHHKYMTEILSVEPLLIYINDFLSSHEVAHLDALIDSSVDGLRTTGNLDTEAPLEQRQETRPLSGTFPANDQVVKCMSQRASSFLGFLDEDRQIVGPLFVQYFQTKELQLHYDIPEEPEEDGQGGRYVRQASFFVYLESECTGGETLFPFLEQAKNDADPKKFAATRSGKGLAIRPVRGNAIFWMNTHQNGSRIANTQHGSLPILKGHKAGINIWSKKKVE